MADYRKNLGPDERSSRRQLLRRAALGGVGLAGGSLLACSSRAKQARTGPGAPAASAQPQAGGTFHGFLNGGNFQLDPMMFANNQTEEIAGAVMSRLFRFQTGPDPDTINDHNVESDLALSAESPDAVTWTLKLRPDAKFHNTPPVGGHTVQAEDIKATFTRALTPQNPNRGSLDMIDPSQIQTPDAQTIVFKLKYAYSPFQKTMASPIYSWIFPREVLVGGYDPAKQVIGSGPFTLESFTPDASYALKKNPDWFEKGRPYVDGVELAVIPDTSQQLAQFSGRHLDEVRLGAYDLDTMQRSNPKAATLQNHALIMGTVFFPLGDPTSAWQDIRVRRALSMAIDYEAIGKSIFNGKYAPSLSVPQTFKKWALGLDQLDSEIRQYYRYNPAEAKKLLQAAGVLDQTFKFAYVNSGGFGVMTWYQKEAEAIRSMFSAVGLKTVPVGIDFLKDYTGGGTGKGYRQGYVPKDTIPFGVLQQVTDIDELLFSYFDSASTTNQERLGDAAFDEMIKKARTLVNEDERLKAYLGIQTHIASKVYLCCAGEGYSYIMTQPRVQNFQVGSPQGEVVESYSKLWLKQ
jgi:peptide/nickel transport system substrate-binding protein